MKKNITAIEAVLEKHISTYWKDKDKILPDTRQKLKELGFYDLDEYKRSVIYNRIRQKVKQYSK